MATKTYLGVAALLALQAIVVAWAVMPDVDPIYRAVYVDRTSNCYPLVVTGDYRLGERLSFATDGDAARRSAISRCGFREPDRVGSWSDGKESRLRFRLAHGNTDLVMELELAPFVTETVPRQRIWIDANDTRVADIVLTEPGIETIRIGIPRELLSPAATVLDLTLTYPDAAPSRPLDTSKARYTYAVHVVALRLEAAVAQKQSAVPREVRNRAR